MEFDQQADSDGASIAAAPPDLQEIPNVEEPDEEIYYAAIASGELGTDKERETHARLLAWHKSNDSYRELKPEFGSPGPPIYEPRRSNLERLTLLLGTNVESSEDEEWNSLLRAELSRELGDFETARSWL